MVFIELFYHDNFDIIKYMKTKEYIAVLVGIAAAGIMWGSAGLSADFSPFLPVQGIDLLSLSKGKEPALQSPEAVQAWAVFEEYLEYAKNHDIEGVISISHSPSATCTDPSRVEECKTLLDTGYSRGSVLEKEKFVNAWSDEHQIILSTNYITIDLSSLNARGRARSIIYFSKDEHGTPKLIGFNPNEITFIEKGSKTNEEADRELDRVLTDSDKDSLPDIKELCQSSSGAEIAGCMPTDPYDPDTNGNGWWDGIEILIRR
jgi:hypothetical protein